MYSKYCWWWVKLPVSIILMIHCTLNKNYISSQRFMPLIRGVSVTIKGQCMVWFGNFPSFVMLNNNGM